MKSRFKSNSNLSNRCQVTKQEQCLSEDPTAKEILLCSNLQNATTKWPKTTELCTRYEKKRKNERKARLTPQRRELLSPLATIRTSRSLKRLKARDLFKEICFKILMSQRPSLCAWWTTSTALTAACQPSDISLPYQRKPLIHVRKPAINRPKAYPLPVSTRDDVSRLTNFTLKQAWIQAS